MSIDCPACNKKMHDVFYHGVKARFCMSCKGFFLKPDQFERIKDASEIDISDDAPKTMPGGTESMYYCPDCNESMSKHQYGKLLKTQVDVCDICKSIWLNKGELTRLEYDHAVVKRNTEINQGTRIKCPKCGLSQQVAAQCKRCGVIFEKLRATKTKKPGPDMSKPPLERWALKQVEQFHAWMGIGAAHGSRLKSFFDFLYQNTFTFFLMRVAGWALILVCVYIVWLILLYIFSNVSMPPPKPTGIDKELSRVSIFYIFSIALAGPILLTITFVIWRILWYSLYGPIELLIHRFFHPLIKPIIAIGLLLLFLQSVSLFAHGFWTSYWWLGQQFEQAQTHQL